MKLANYLIALAAVTPAFGFAAYNPCSVGDVAHVLSNFKNVSTASSDPMRV